MKLFIHSLTGTRMWVAPEREEEYRRAGHTPAAEKPEAAPHQEAAPEPAAEQPEAAPAEAPAPAAAPAAKAAAKKAAPKNKAAGK